MKHLTAIIILAFLCMTVNATDLSVARKSKKKKKTQQTEQKADPIIITQTIWGCTVGTSTKAQVMDTLSKRGFSIAESEGVLTATKADMSFGGLNWNTAQFYFSGNTLMDVTFESHSFESFNAAASSYEALNSRLNAKYKAQHDGSAKNANYEKFDLYKDTYTGICLYIKQQQTTRSFTIVFNYVNLKLYGGFGKEAIQEL